MLDKEFSSQTKWDIAVKAMALIAIALTVYSLKKEILVAGAMGYVITSGAILLGVIICSR